MNLKFNKVRLHNFFSYSDAELNLSDMGYSIVSGKNRNISDNALSNGSGKSSIFNAICFALTGETAQGLSNNVENIYTDPTDCWVEVELRVDNDEFIIKRFKAPRPDLKIFINGEDRSGKGIRESQQLLDGYIPDLTSQLIGSIIILGQGLPYRFTYNTPSARKALLEKLTKSDYMVQSIRDKLDNRRNDLKIQLRKVEDENISNITQTNIYSERIQKLKEDLIEYENCSKDGLISDKINEIKNSISSNNSLSKEKREELEQINLNIKNLTDERFSITQESSVKLTDSLTSIDSEINSLNKDLADKKAEVKYIEKEVKKLESVSDICPTCGQKIHDMSKFDTTDLKKKLSTAKVLVEDIAKNYNESTNKKELIIKEHSDTLNSKCKNIDDELSKLSEEKRLTELKLNSLNTLSQNLIKEELKLTNLQNNYLKLHDEILETGSKLEVLKENKVKIESDIRDLNEHLNVIQNLITLAKREFRSVLLESVVRYLDKKAREYSKDVFGSESVMIQVDENYINVMYKEKFYESLSGGEKQKIDIIIQLALRDLLSNQLNIHSNILVLDEIFDNLDNVGCQRILDLISKINDIESVFIISHHVNELQISYDTEVVVEKGEDGISSIAIH